MKIAVIGTGITGNAASWLLNQSHDITIYERHDRPGGHSNTVQIDGHPPIDTGFIVYNDWTYPNLIELFKHLDVQTDKTDMSFAVSMDDGKLEYAGHKLFAQPKNKLSPRFLTMLKDVKRFYATAPKYLESKQPNMPLGLYLKKKKYSEAFIRDHILPMAAAIWSSGIGEISKFPAKSFIRFFKNHGLLLMKNRPKWRTVHGGSREYVQKLIEPFKDKILFGTAAVSVYRRAEGIEITDSRGNIAMYDAVVLACHTDQALRLLQDATDREKEILGYIPYNMNKAYLHQDESLMPGLKSVWSSWNYLSSTADGKVAVTYWMNKLQPGIGRKQNYFVTLNPPREPKHILQEMSYSHPIFNADSVKLWRELRTIQGRMNTWYCGAWCGFGFHEDGLSAGLRVAESIGPTLRPWRIKENSPAGTYAAPDTSE